MCQMVVVLDQMVRFGSKFAQRKEGEGRRLYLTARAKKRQPKPKS